MFISKKKINKTDNYTVQILENIRINGKYKQHIIKYIGYAKSEAELKSLLEQSKKYLQVRVELTTNYLYL